MQEWGFMLSGFRVPVWSDGKFWKGKVAILLNVRGFKMANRYLLIYILRCFQNLILMEEGYRKYIQVAKTKTFFFF